MSEFQPPSKGRVVFITVEQGAEAEVALVTRVVSDTVVNVRVLHDDSRSPTHLRGVAYQMPMTNEQRSKVCRKAPVGWQCTRDAGHDGPCAAEQAIVGPTWHWPPFVAPKKPAPTSVPGSGAPRTH